MLHLDENFGNSSGTWFWLFDTGNVQGSETGEDTYMGHAITEYGESQWINAENWIGWLEVANAPWIWSSSSSTWFYIKESTLCSEGFWGWVNF